jgi:hypothetical protein
MGDRIKFGKRRYSTLEIDAMRYYLYIRTTRNDDLSSDGCTGYSGLNTEQQQVLEQKLRTYMLNGTDPEELYELAVEAERVSYDNRTRYYREKHGIDNPQPFTPILRMGA